MVECSAAGYDQAVQEEIDYKYKELLELIQK